MTKHSVKQAEFETQGLGVGGIDVAKDWHYVQWLDAQGQPIGKAMRFANSRAGFESMWDRRPTTAGRVGHETFEGWSESKLMPGNRGQNASGTRTALDRGKLILRNEPAVGFDRALPAGGAL